MARAAINGLGRIGRAALKIINEKNELDLVAINDLVPPDNLAYLLKHDTVYGKYEKDVIFDDESLTIEGKVVKVLSEKDPEKLPLERA